MLRAALEYEKKGFSVIPIKTGEKSPPLVKWEQYQERKATKEEIAQWWVKTPKANIGIITGKISNLFVIDIDSAEGQENISKYVPDSLITPTVKTPKGQHLYFKYPEGQNITVGTNKIKGTDFRGENGYVLAPPSINNVGQRYEWVLNLDTPFADLPTQYINYLINCIYIGSGSKKQDQLLQSVTLCFDKGTRNDSLFTVANTLCKGGMKKADSLMLLNILAENCNPPIPESEIVTICNSALERAERKERNLAKEVEAWVLLQTGYFSVTSCYNELQVVTKEGKGAVRIALSRLKDKLIEKYGEKDGVYRRITEEIEFITFDKDEKEEVPFPVRMPFDLHEIAEISEGNVIIVAGEFNAGKSAFLLNVLRMNKGQVPIRYITSEMRKSEFKKRFRGFGLPSDYWTQDGMTDYVRKSADFHMALKPDGINIIDYLEFKDSEYNRGAEFIRQISDKLTKGIAIVAVQKKEGQRMPRAGDMIMEKPRLAIAFSKINDSSENPQGWCEILKAKAPLLGKIDGKRLRYEIANMGSRFNVLNNWGYYRGM